MKECFTCDACGKKKVCKKKRKMPKGWRWGMTYRLIYTCHNPNCYSLAADQDYVYHNGGPDTSLSHMSLRKRVDKKKKTEHNDG